MRFYVKSALYVKLLLRDNSANKFNSDVEKNACTLTSL